MLRDNGIELSAAQVIEAFESMKIRKIRGLKNLYVFSNMNVDAVDVADGSFTSAKDLCNQILTACGAEPPDSLEIASIIFCKRGVKFDKI